MEFYKFKSLKPFKYASDIIMNERLYCANYGKLNDPFEGLFFVIIRDGAFSSAFDDGFDVQEKRCKKIFEPFKICSLSKELSDVKMWSFYANDHKGIAIEIDFTGRESEPLEVSYLPALPEYNLAHPNPADILTKKTKQWCYETEYRIIQESEYFSIKGRIKAIYLGQRISNLNLKKLNQIIPSTIPIFTTKLDTDEIKIKRDKLFNRKTN